MIAVTVTATVEGLAAELRKLADALEAPSLSVSAPHIFKGPEYEPEPMAEQPKPFSALSVCPQHHVGWTVREAGETADGRAYEAFWKCGEKDDDGRYCKLKPVKAWRDSHPAR